MSKRHFLYTAMALLMVTGLGYGDRNTFDNTLTRVAMPLSEPPTIDGFIDLAGGEAWVYTAGATPNGNAYWEMRYDDTKDDFVYGGNVASGQGPLYPEDFAADMYVGYDDDYLYVAVRVVDDVPISDSAEAGSANGTTWYDDSVEVFVDGDNSNHPERDTAGSKPEGWSSGGQYVVTINNAYREAEAGNPGYGEDAAWHGLSGVGPNGESDFEFRISWSILGGKPEKGQVIGFDIAINDDDDGSTAENQYTWSGQTHVEATYGNLVIGPRTYTAPKVNTSPTVDGTVNASEYAGAAEIVVNHHTGNYALDDFWALGDHDYSAWVVHDDEAIYVAISVIDDIIVTDTAAAGSEDGSTWEDDSAEIFFDSDYSRDRGRNSGNLFEGQYVLTPIGAWRDNEANNPLYGEDGDWFAAGATTGVGYSLEFKVVKESLFEFTPVLGFDIAVNDDDGAGRKTQLAWNGYPHNEATYGELILSEGGTAISEWSLY